ncbi:hypothetical protein [Actinophytocola algeriensis]|uniref:Uncharacterized protein n=1 Tax=Actinophytocola algeriensis TaxID=1768010 RepID=A0A7W7QBD0_9PSEU|nr:hypothetical protein [Actinophytocola algeriensis]MBB4910313.1 hypothetical protein [Actinophytocola algeriensis]MBE1480698.1 hypothetical protein [Actinophytocola algeriensis]
MRGDRADGDPVEHFLEDGVAPSVIGGGPPESPFDLEPDPEPPGRQTQGRHTPGRQAHYRPEPDYQAQRQEPPTSPIPVVRQPPSEQEPEKRKGWMARMFRAPEK